MWVVWHRKIAGMNLTSHSLAGAAPAFFGPWVVRATFVMAMFGWGMGFYGPSIFLHDVVQRTGWPLTLVSGAVTLHYLVGAVVVTQLPALHKRLGIGPPALAGALLTALGVVGWSVASARWQLFASAMLSGAGWVTMGAVAVNAAIAPWYVQRRPMALAKAYNGASIGGVVFSPLWVLLMARWGFTVAAAVLGLLTVVVMLMLWMLVFRQTPQRLWQRPDGDAAGAVAVSLSSPLARELPGRLLWRDRRFITLALGMAAGLFAQIGLLAHLFSVLVPALGAQAAGLTLGFATACAIGGRLLVARLMPAAADRRVVAALGYAVQLVGSLLLLASAGQHMVLILVGVALFGSGLGNATSLPPLIAQVEFVKADLARVVALIVALAQASYAFAPALLGWVLSATSAGAPQLAGNSAPFFLLVAAVQGLALLSFLAGRRGA